MVRFSFWLVAAFLLTLLLQGSTTTTVLAWIPSSKRLPLVPSANDRRRHQREKDEKERHHNRYATTRTTPTASSFSTFGTTKRRTTTTSRMAAALAQPHRRRRAPSLLVRRAAAKAASTSTKEQHAPRPLDLYMYNSRTRQKELCEHILREDNNNMISMYTCGPTVYDEAHIGNFRAFLTYDVLKRVLQYLGYHNIKHVLNITDIDDKILKKANHDKIPIGQIGSLTEKYETIFLQDLQKLHILPATIYPRATQHVPAMIRFVQDLAIGGYAYETPDGSWYFDTQKDAASYGQQLVNINYDDMQEQKETENEDSKRHWADFCLWKAYKPDGEDRTDAIWDSETCCTGDDDLPPQKMPLSTPVINKGRPGWHLECSAMAQTYFGDGNTLDFHGGGMDLKFPHHENEIAQSQALGVNNNYLFCNCWFHNGFVNIGTNDDKMSKSLGNFLTLSTACPTTLDIRAYRYLVVSSQYRNPLTFTDTVLDASKKAIKRMDMVLAKLEEQLDHNNKNNSSAEAKTATSMTTTATAPTEDNDDGVIQKALQNFEVAIADDLSMPRAAASLFAVIKYAEQALKKKKTHDNDNNVNYQAIYDAILQMDRVFGVFYKVPGMEDDGQKGDGDEAPTVVPDEVMELVGQRTVAKEAKDWELADSLRKRIQELGFSVKDVKGGGDPIVTPFEQQTS